MRDFCSSCGTPIDGTRQYCATCGVFLGWKTWAPPLDARICPHCEAPNAPDREQCGHCFKSLRGGGGDWICGTAYLEMERLRQEPVSVASANDKPAGSMPAGACATCGFVNTPAEVFCANCGRFLEWDGAVAGVVAKPHPPFTPEPPR